MPPLVSFYHGWVISYITPLFLWAAILHITPCSLRLLRFTAADYSFPPLGNIDPEFRNFLGYSLLPEELGYWAGLFRGDFDQVLVAGALSHNFRLGG